MNNLFIIRKEGGSRVIAVTRLLPDWTYVEVKKVASTKDSVTLKIMKVK